MGNEALGADRQFADLAAEALLMPLLALVLVLLRAGLEDAAAAVAASSECIVVTVGTVEMVTLGSEWLINK